MWKCVCNNNYYSFIFTLHILSMHRKYMSYHLCTAVVRRCWPFDLKILLSIIFYEHHTIPFIRHGHPADHEKDSWSMSKLTRETERNWSSLLLWQGTSIPAIEMSIENWMCHFCIVWHVCLLNFPAPEYSSCNTSVKQVHWTHGDDSWLKAREIRMNIIISFLLVSSSSIIARVPNGYGYYSLRMSQILGIYIRVGISTYSYQFG